MNLNKVTVAGNLVRDPELRYTPKGSAVVKIGIAVNRNWTGEDGQKKEEVTFIDCEAWGKVAEIIGQYCKKGRPIYVEGRLKLDSWEDKNTKQKMSKLKVVVDSFQFVGGKPEGDTQRSTPPPRPTAAPPAAEPPPESDDVPF